MYLSILIVKIPSYNIIIEFYGEQLDLLIMSTGWFMPCQMTDRRYTESRATFNLKVRTVPPLHCVLAYSLINSLKS